MSKLQNFMDENGRFKQWPVKRSLQLEAIAYLAEKFAFDKDYSETEVNDLLSQWHTFDDSVLLRRELVVQGDLDRTADGRRYWKVKRQGGNPA